MNFLRVAVVFVFTLQVNLGWSQESDRARNVFDRWDKNNDGRLTKDELPKALQRNFEKVDRNQDGFISRQEDSAFRNAGRGPNRRSASLPANVKVTRDLAYVANGHERQKLDIYFVPRADDEAKPAARPLIIWIHGGAWRAGSKDRCPATFLLENGFAVASINYRLSQHAIFPAQIHDCKTAIAWLRKNAEKFNLDARNFGVWGSSAGGHLASLVGTSANVKELEPNGLPRNDSRVQAVCDWFGPTNILLMNKQAGAKGKMDHDAQNSPESLLIGGTLQENPDKAKRVNPVQYISEDDPPFLIMHGDQDFLVPIQQSQLLHEALKKSGVESKFEVIRGKGHGGFDLENVRPKIISFFQRHLRQ